MNNSLSNQEETDPGFWQPVSQRNSRKPPSDDSHSSPSDYSHPVFKKLSHINGDINAMELIDLKKKIEEHHLHPRGNDCVLKKRLKLFYKTRLMDQQGLSNVHKADIDYILVIDFEATCEDDQNDFPHEIIEFPVVVISVSEKRVVDQYHSYVRPVRRPVLTPFCKNLTGITQAQVDGSPLFTTVLVDMWKWVLEHNYHRRMAILTDGPWDMSRFMYLQCIHSKIDFPKWARKWINIRKLFINFYGTQRLNLAGMLEAIGETFQGHPHAGIDDSINIARIAICLLNDGAKIEINELLYKDKMETVKRFARNVSHSSPQVYHWQPARRGSCHGASARAAQASGSNYEFQSDHELATDMDNLNL